MLKTKRLRYRRSNQPIPEPTQWWVLGNQPIPN